MKNVILLLGVLFMMVSCGPDYKQQLLDLQLKHDSLIAVHDLKNSELIAHMNDLSEIQANISSLIEQENLLKQAAEGDVTASVRDKILSDLEAIKTELQNNKKKLASVQSKLKKANAKISDLEKTIASLNEQMAMRDSSLALLGVTIETLNNKVQAAETEIAAVKSDNEVKAKEIADKTSRLNTAYYAVGTYKDLREKQVISNEGSIFKSKEVNPNFVNDSFIKIDVTTTKTIFLANAKSVKLASSHPADSYSLVKENNKVKSIEITNPERFWAGSKYLIAVIQ